MIRPASLKLSFLLLLILASLTAVTGATALADQPNQTATPVINDLLDPSIPPLSEGAPAEPKPAADAPLPDGGAGTLIQSAPDAPAITIWYGSSQTFGPNGDPQKWVNILGNVTSAAPLSSLTYTLNGGSSQTLTVGANGSRLAQAGDFNIELDYTDLLPGANTVVITATDNTAALSQAVVTVNYQTAAGNWPPQTYTINWAGATKVNDVAQVVDGKWIIDAGKARPTVFDFDRLVAIGDISWRDYTVTVPITVNSMNLNKSPGIGVMVRWQGHYDAENGIRPYVGWRRLGAMAWYRYEKGPPAVEGLQLLGHRGQEIGAKPFVLTLGKTYMFKVNIVSGANPSKPATYRFKVWDAALSEPAVWDIEKVGISGEPRNGSILLVAHHADASFGNVTVNLASTEPKPELTLGTVGTGSGTVLANPQKATYRFGEDVTVSATPAGGSTFDGWQGDASGTANPTNVEMFADRSVKALFVNPNVQTPISDDFNGCGLNGQLWTFINPLDDGTLTMNGSQAEIEVPSGSAHDIWSGGFNAPRIMQYAEDEDFEFDVKFDSAMSMKNQAQGVLIQGDGNNAIRFNYLHDGGSYKVQVYTFVNGVPETAKLNQNITTTPPMYLRVKRVGNVWNLYHSGNGTTWNFAAGFQFTMVVNSYGAYVANSSQNPATVGKIDYFFNTKSPIAPEDDERKLNVAYDGSGTVTRDPAKENYACDETVTLTPVPAAGSKFDSWSGDLTGTANPGVVVMNGTKNITAKFVADVQYQINLTPNGQGTVAKSPDKPGYSPGESVTLTATPNIGYLFTNWSGDVTSAANPFMVTVSNNMTIVGNFAAAPPRTLTVTYNGNGTVTKDPDKATYLQGGSVTLMPVPAAGASFVNWSGAASGSVVPLMVVMDGDKTITANFADNIYTLTIPPDPNGSVTADPQKAAYYQGEVVELTPVPALGYVFTGWSGDLTGDDVPGLLTMTKNSVVTATFASDATFSLAVSVSGGSGTVTKNPSKTEYNFGEEVTLTAIPGAGFEFTGWSGDLTGSDNPAVIEMTENKAITAHFAGEGIYSLTILPPTNGTVEVAPVRDLYAQDEQVTLTAVPALGYVFTGWGEDLSGSTNPLTFQMTGNITASATFDIAPLYNLNLTANGPGSVAVDPPGTQFFAGTTVTLTAAAESGYVFTGWSGDLVSNVNPYSLVIAGDKSIVANFSDTTEVVSDDFDGCGTVSSQWSWVDPLGQADYELTGTQLKIVVPPGVNYEVWKNGNDGARLMQDVSNTDFELIVKLDSAVTKGYQTQGVLIETDDDTFLRIDFHHNGEGLRLFAGTVDNGTSRNRFTQNLPTPPSGAMSMRVQRTGDTWRTFYRLNEADPWTGFQGSNFKFGMNVTRVGVFAASQPLGNQPAPGHTALFDYFFNADTPIAPEDANAPSIAVMKVGQGNVTMTPNSAAYTCGQQVELKATPAAGWGFFNWSGDLNGSVPTQMLTVGKKHVVTATFVEVELIEHTIYLPAAIR